MSDIDRYRELIVAIEAAGYFTSFRRNVPGGLLVCVSRKDPSGRLHGNSFLVTKKNGTWCVSTWGDEGGYKVTSQQILSVCLDCLGYSSEPLAQIPNGIVEKYGLRKFCAES